MTNPTPLVEKLRRRIKHDAPFPALGAGMLVNPDGLEAADEIERLQALLGEIEQWCGAYPVDMFPEPDLALVKERLGDEAHQLDRMHGSWARHILGGISKIAAQSLLASLPRGEEAK